MTSHLVEILLPKTAGDGRPLRQGRFEELLRELTERFGGATSFVRLPGKGLWETGGNVATDNIAVIEVMTEGLDVAYWRTLRQRLERELSQEEIVIRAREISRL
jgi:hypothetical protein